MAHRGRNSIPRVDKKKIKKESQAFVCTLSLHCYEKYTIVSEFFPQKVLYIFLYTYSVNKHKLQS